MFCFTVGAKKSCWNSVHTIGTLPTGRYGHSLVFHAPSNRVFLFGGSNQVN
jgi:hypothetical protein